MQNTKAQSWKTVTQSSLMSLNCDSKEFYVQNSLNISVYLTLWPINQRDRWLVWYSPLLIFSFEITTVRIKTQLWNGSQSLHLSHNTTYQSCKLSRIWPVLVKTFEVSSVIVDETLCEWNKVQLDPGWVEFESDCSKSWKSRIPCRTWVNLHKSKSPA